MIRDAWSAYTSADPHHWSPENPAWGQCAVTALLMQDLLGGELLRGLVDGQSHYWNRLPDGTEIDLTLEQFGPGAAVDGAMPRGRSYVLSFPDTASRYDLLRRFVARSLHDRQA